MTSPENPYYRRQGDYILSYTADPYLYYLVQFAWMKGYSAAQTLVNIQSMEKFGPDRVERAAAMLRLLGTPPLDCYGCG